MVELGTRVGDDGILMPTVLRRLDGIDMELRDLRSLMAQLVRVEEKGNADRAETSRLSAELATYREDLRAIRERAMRMGYTVGTFERVIWALFAGSIAWASGWLR